MTFGSIFVATFFAFLISACQPQTTATQNRPTTQVAEPIHVQYAGVALLGNWSDRSHRYPFLAEIFSRKNADKVPLVDAYATKQVQLVNNAYITLRVGGNASLTEDTLNLAFTFSDENIDIQRYRGNFLVSYEISASLLLFDMSTKRIVGNFPRTIRFSELARSMPDKKHQQGVVSSMLLDPKFSANCPSSKHLGPLSL